ncbi:MAG: choice-of-anchor L domain-containing protein [Flavobacteriales bacterium]|nr:choice-of-anchor L domain-containing protein [Flavobacteriales bacterium]
MEPELYSPLKITRNLLALILVLIAGLVNAQISVNQASTTAEVEQLVEDVLLGSCVTVSNVNYIGPASASGTFNASGTTFTMQNGILLTTGRANIAVGPDNDNDATVELSGVAGDANLTSLAGHTTYDAVILEFDFVPQDDTLTFRYVFGSEEYPEWVNSQYNDVFGFFISGPGINGPYLNNAANIALIPGTTTPVAINNVNNGYSQNEPANGPCTNCAYYVDNSSGPDVQYDGYTTVLTAQAIVTPCQTYHIRLAIADAGDRKYDSGVFLEAGSFTSGGGITVDFTNVGIEEGCSDEYIVFSRVNQSNNSTAISATYSIGGTATMGTDYNTFPTVVTIPAGQDTVMIPIVVPLDFTVEGTETIVVYMDQPPCDCLAPGSATINVIDNDVPLALTTTGETTICLGQSANLTASVSGSLPPYSYSWNNGAPAGEDVTVSPTNTTTYTFTVTDACNSQTETSTETVTVIRPDFTTNDESQCFDGNAFSFTNTGATGGTVSHYWTFGDGASSTDENPSHSFLADGDYTVTHYVIFLASNCTASASATMTVFPEPTVSVSVDANVICAGGTDGALSSSVSGGTAGYSYLWSPGGQTTSSITGVGIGGYSVTVTDANGCTDSDSGTIIQTDSENPTITCPPTANLSTEAGLCTSSAAIGTPTTSDNCGVASTVVSNSGPYPVGTTNVTWTTTDVNGNTASCSQDVVVTDDENPAAVCQNITVYLDGAGNASITAADIDGGSTDNCGVASTSASTTSFTCASVGGNTVTLTVTDVNGNSSSCNALVSVADTVSPAAVCQNITVYLDGAGNASITAADIDGGSTDNCGVASTSASTTSFTCASVGGNTVTLTVTDVNGNASSCDAVVSVADTVSPAAVCQNITVYLDGAGNASITAADIDGGSTDNCGVASTSASTTSFTCASVGGNTVTLTVTDVNGNSSSCDALVSVADTVSPAAVCQNITVFLDGAGNASITAADIDGGSTDNCGVASTTASTTSFTCASVGGNTVTLTVTDVNGNSSSCDAVVSVADTVSPAAVCQNITVYLDGAGNASITAAHIDGGSTDNCGVASTSASTTSFTCASVGGNTVTLTVTDVNGNASSCDAVVSVADTVSPAAVCQNITVQLDASGSASISAYDVDGGSSDNCADWSLSVSQASFDCSNLGSNTVTLTVDDVNGNSSSCNATVTVEDDIDPSLVGCPSDITVTASSNDCAPSVNWTAPTANDNCSATVSSNYNSGDNFPVGTTVVTYTATDVAGNSVSCSFDVTINPTQLVVSISPSTLLCGTNISCAGETDGWATANVSGGCEPYSYEWSDGQTTQTAVGLGAGTYTVEVTDANGSVQSESITLTEPNELVIDGFEISEYVGGAGVSCNGASDGEIDLTIIGGAECEAYIISWTGPNGFTSSNEDLTGLEAGTYNVTVEDVNGCSTTGSYTITEPDALSPTCTSEDALCNEDANGSVEVSVTGGTEPYSYAWSNGSADASQSGLFAGTYGVTVTDANGCITTCSSVVSEPNVLVAVVTAYDETLVNGCNGSAVANPTGGTSPYTYDWSDGQTTQTAIDLCAGIYSVTVTDANGCEYTTSVVINPPTCDLDVDVTATDVSCNNGSDGTATATPITVQNNTPFTYVWNNSGTTQTINGITAGPYSVVVTDSIGCEASGSVVVSEPSALTVGTSVIDELTFEGCDGSATANPNGGTSPYTYEWSDGQTMQTASSLCPGTYTVTVTDANGCEETVTITVNPLLCTGFSVAINTERLSCFEAGDGSATAVVTGGTAPFTYSWSNGGTGSSISNLAAGQYTVTVTDAVNCSQTVSGNVTQPALLEAATAVDNVTCHGVSNGVVELTVTGGTTPYSFDWSNGSTTEDLENLGPGTYNVTITDENGCTTTASGTVTQPDTLGASSIDVQVSCNGGDNGSIDLTPTGGLGPYLYTWNTGAHTQDLNDLSAGTYSVTFADQNGCLFTYETTISEPDVLDLTCTSEDALCNGDDNGSVEVSVAGGTAPFSYSWSNGSTDASQNGLGAGTYVVTVTDDNGCVSTCSSIVGEPDVLTAVVVVQDETLVNGCNGYATANPTGGTPPYSYEWSDGQTTQTAVNLCAGTYTVIVTDANECEFTTSNIVNPPSCDLDVDVTGTDVSCNDGSDGSATATPITVQNNTPFTYVWNNSGTTQTINGITAGPYSVVVTDSIGCEASGSVVISEPTALSVSTVVVDELTFNGCDGSATANPSGGTSPYTYAWSDSQTTQTASNLCPGTYTVTITDANGCEETVTITVNPLLCTGFSVAINTERLSCFEAGDGSATAVVSGGTAPFTYAWSNGGTGSTIANLAAGQYTVTVTDAVNCSQTVSGNVTQPALLEAATAVDNVSCHGIGNGVVELTVTGGTTPYTFNWDNGAITEDLNNVGPGSYNVTITDGNGCTTSASATVTEPDTLQASSVDVNPTCFEGNDGSIDLTVSGGLGPYLVSWDNGSNTADISGLSAGTYTATIVDQNGCIYTYSTTLSEPNLVIPTITADGPTIFCQGDSVTLTASEAAGYSWSPNGETTQSITVYDAGDYSVSVVTEDGCDGISAATSVTMFQVDLATIIPDGPTEFCDGSSVVLSASQGSSYLWMPNGETTQSITVSEAGNYSVTVTDENGCESSSDDIEITVFDLPEPIVTADGPLTFCDGGSVTLTSSESASYAWAPFGQTTQSIVVTESGIYRVTITNEDGCQSTSDPTQVIVNENPEPIISSDGNTEFCEGSFVTLSGPAGFIYNWSPNGETIQTIAASETGDYQLTVTDEFGCVGESNVISVTVFDVDTAVISTQGPTEFCDGGEVVLVSSEGDSYSWSPNGETSQSINVSSSGTYSVTVTDANGCVTTSDPVDVVVNPLPDATVTLSGPTEFCEGDSVVLTAPAGFSYFWSPNGEFSQSITVFNSGTFSVTVFDGNECASVSDPVTTTLFELDPVEVTASGNTEFCDGGQVTLTASTGSTFLWSPNGETTQSITVSESGFYTVSVVDANGCGYASADTVEVIVNPNPEPTITADGPTEFCQESSVTLTSSEADTYAWAPFGQTTQSITVTDAGIYRVTVTDQNGCQGTSDPVVITVFALPEPEITANGPLTICPEDSVILTSSSADGNLWAPNAETTQSITVYDAGTYSVTVTDVNGCVGESGIVIVTEFETEPVSVIVDGNTVFCEGGEVTLSASSGDIFSWSPNGETSQSITVSESGDYSVVATDANGCSADSDTISVTVNELPQPTISLSGPSTFCAGDSVVLTVTEGEAYLWEPNGQTTQSITVNESGSYWVQIADENTCVANSDTIDVIVNEPVTIEVVASGNTEFCDGGQVLLSASGGQSFQWAPNGEQTQSIVVTEAGEYSVEVIDLNGCSSSSDTVDVEVFALPEVEVVSSSMEICDGDSAQLTASANGDVTFEWLANGNSISGATDSVLYVSDQASYTVIVSDENGCEATDNAPVISVGPVPVAVITGDGFACPGDSLMLVASGGDNYLWSNGETTSSISVLADSIGVYFVTVSNDFCNQTSSDSASVGVYDAPSAVIETMSNGFLEVQHLFEEVSGDSSIVYWTWDFGDGLTGEEQSMNHTYSDEGYFTIIVITENEYGCIGLDTVEVEITQVIDIPNVFTPNHDGVNDQLFIGNFGVDNYEITIYNRWGIIMHHDDTGEVFWDGKTPAGVDAEAGTYYFELNVLNQHSEGSFNKTGYITLIR